MISNQNWNNLYPRNEYPHSPRSKTLTLHFLIHLKQPICNIVDFVKKNPHKLTVKDPAMHSVTPLHVAVMQDGLQYVIALLGISKKIINAQDDQGWTALHHARLVSSSIYEALLSAGADPTIRNNQGATAEDLDYLTGKKVIQNSLSTTFLELPDQPTRPLSELGEKELEQLLGVKRLYDRCLYPQTQWKALWDQKLSTDQNPVNDIYKKLLFDAQDKFPKLILRPNKMLEGEDSHCFELVTDEKIEKNRVVCVITGLMKEKLPPIKSFEDEFRPPRSEIIYSLNDIDAENEGGIWRFINSGWPNLIQVVAEGVQGGNVCFLVAPDEIQKGERLLWDYGPGMSSLVWGPYKLFEKDRMREWFKPDLLEQLNKMQEMKTSVEQDFAKKKIIEKDLWIPFYAIGTKIGYPLHNPAALLDLIFSETTTLEAWKKFVMSNHRVTERMKQEAPESFSRMILLLAEISRFKSKSTLLAPDLKKKIHTWVLSKIGFLTVMQIVKAIQLIRQAIEDKQLSVGIWEAFASNLDNILPDYNWLEDEDAPLGRKRLREVQMSYFRDHPENLQAQLDNMLKEGGTEENEPIQRARWLLKELKS